MMTMKKWAVWSATVLIAAAVAVPGAAGAADMKDMKPMYDYSKVEVMKQDGMDLVPLRAVAESLGYQVQWNNADRSVTLTKGGMGMDPMMGDSMKKDGMGGGMMDKSMMDKMMTDKPMMDKSMMDKSMVMIKIGSKTVMVNGMEKMLMAPVMIMNDMTYVGKDLVDMYLLVPDMMMK